MDDKLITYKTGVLARDKGFKEFCRTAVVSSDEYMYIEQGFYYESYVLAPTQSLLQRWLREEYNIIVQITAEPYIDGINWNFQVFIFNNKAVDCWDDKSTGMYGDNGEYSTYEEALEAGLLEALKLI